MARTLALTLAALGAGNTVPRSGDPRRAVSALSGLDRLSAIRPPRVFSSRELASTRNRYMPHQGKRECRRRAMGGFAGVPRHVQDGAPAP